MTSELWRDIATNNIRPFSFFFFSFKKIYNFFFLKKKENENENKAVSNSKQQASSRALLWLKMTLLWCLSVFFNFNAVSLTLHSHRRFQPHSLTLPYKMTKHITTLHTCIAYINNKDIVIFIAWCSKRRRSILHLHI